MENMKAAAQPQKLAEITITMFADGRVITSGSIDNKLLAYGLLSVAQETVSEHHKQADRLVQPVTLGMPRL